jgi:hypothetical protein
MTGSYSPHCTAKADRIDLARGICYLVANMRPRVMARRMCHRKTDLAKGRLGCLSGCIIVIRLSYSPASKPNVLVLSDFPLNRLEGLFFRGFAKGRSGPQRYAVCSLT